MEEHVTTENLLDLAAYIKKAAEAKTTDNEKILVGNIVRCFVQCECAL